MIFSAILIIIKQHLTGFHFYTQDSCECGVSADCVYQSRYAKQTQAEFALFAHVIEALGLCIEDPFVCPKPDGSGGFEMDGASRFINVPWSSPWPTVAGPGSSSTQS